MNSQNWPWKPGESLRFDRFMDLALHDPERGYYARRIRGVGRGGDFTTTPMLTPALGKAVAAWAESAMRATGCRDLIELGPGEGLLAQAVLAGLPWLRRMRVRLHLVERSVPLREKQRARLGSKVRWHESIEAALEACQGRACIYSNEFADAFPVRRFRREAAGWSELHLSPAEAWRGCDELPDSSASELQHSIGQVVEVGEMYHRWLEGWLPSWQAGRMLTLDYGAPIGRLYHRRPRGSVRAYLMQQRLEGPAIYENPGRQDLTADVNFTDLQRWAAPWLETVNLVSQRDFLLAHADASQAGDAHAIDAQGAGAAFLVLDQAPLPALRRGPDAA
ncbi:SAM-dependent methyltransferase [Luteolibacter sp. Populi]|uniref:SAM-dependent methyltransferase n=1 Tax=Luteolibacter sp. Populi TaxID=3230487 RepID=UPI003465FCA9